MRWRRDLPSLLFSAVAATGLMVPWAVGDSSGRQPQNRATDALLIARPLVGVGGGDTLREIRQQTPFSLVALTAADLSGTTARLRAQLPDGSWGPWYDADPADGGGGGGSVIPRGTEPIYVGTTTAVQIALHRPAGATPSTAPPPAAHPGLGYRPASTDLPTGSLNAVLISPPRAPVDAAFNPPEAVTAPGLAPSIISRAQWGANESIRCPNTVYDDGVHAAVVHHTAGSNDYSPADSAAIIRSIYAYHTLTLGWCDIAYNALVDKYGQVFEGRAGGMTRPVEGSHVGGFNRDTWGVAMLGDFTSVAPTPIQLRTTGRLIGWRLGLDGVDPLGSTTLTSDGGIYTHIARGVPVTLPTIFAHRDVGITECPGNAAYALMPLLRQYAAQATGASPGPSDPADALQGGAILARWTQIGGAAGPLGMPTSPEGSGEGDARYATFNHGAVYWSPASGAEPVTGAIYNAWAALGFERGALGLPTSAEIDEPQWIVQNFQHGTLNFDRASGLVTRVIDGVPLQLPAAGTPPVQLERFTPVDN